MPARFPRSVMKVVSIYRLPTTEGSTQPYPDTASSIIRGALIPMDRHAHALEGGDFSDPYELYVSSDTDIKVADKLEIDSTNFYVKKVFAADFGGLRHKRCTLTTEAT